MKTRTNETAGDVRQITYQPWLGLTASQEAQYARCKEALARQLLVSWPTKYSWLTDIREAIANEAACDVMLAVHQLRLPRPSLEGAFPEETRHAAIRRRADLCANHVRKLYAEKRSAAQTVPLDASAEALDVVAAPAFPRAQILGDMIRHVTREDGKILALRLAEGMSFDDIATRMGLDRATVYRRLRRYRGIVGAAMENHFFFADCCNKPARIAE